MSDPDFVILCVKSPTASVDFYADRLGKAPVEASPTFAMLALDSGVMLGLWAAHTVAPAANAVGGPELAFAAAGIHKVESMHADWRARGLEIAGGLSQRRLHVLVPAAQHNSASTEAFRPPPAAQSGSTSTHLEPTP